MAQRISEARGTQLFGKAHKNVQKFTWYGMIQTTPMTFGNTAITIQYWQSNRLVATLKFHWVFER